MLLIYDTTVSELEKKITDHKHDKYFNTPEFNKLTAKNFPARLAQANLITETDFDAKLSSLNRKITINKSKHLLVENELKKLKTYDACYFIGKSHFEDDGTKNYLVFQVVSKYFKTVSANDLLICTNILDMVLDLMEKDFFRLVMKLEEM